MATTPEFQPGEFDGIVHGPQGVGYDFHSHFWSCRGTSGVSFSLPIEVQRLVCHLGLI